MSVTVTVSETTNSIGVTVIDTPQGGSGGSTTIVGITGTEAEFNTALTDGDFVFVGDPIIAPSLQLSGGIGNQGLMSWNAAEETVDLIQDGTVLQIGQEIHTNVRNSSALTMVDGLAVARVGTLGASGRILVDLYNNDGTYLPRDFMGIVTEPIPPGADGKVTHFGKINGVQTNGANYGETWVDGDLLYINPSIPGGLTNVSPPSPSFKASVALVISARASNGIIYVDSEKWDNFDAASEIFSTGLNNGGALSINAGNPSRFDVSAGSGLVVDHTTSPPTLIEVSWDTFTAQTITNLATQFNTDIAINSSGAIVQQASFTDEERRSLIFLGGIDHNNQTTIDDTFSITVPTKAVSSSLSEFARAVGDINISGNVYSANGANLSINKSSGTVFSYGRNFLNNVNAPHQLTTAAVAVVPFGYVFNDGSGNGVFTTDTTLINPNNYDNGTGTLATVANNNWTIQRLLFFPNANKTFIQYGTETFNRQSDALAAVTRASFVALSGIRSAMVRGYLLVKRGETNLSANASFFDADRFGSVSAASSGTVAGGTILEPFFSSYTDYNAIADPATPGTDILRTYGSKIAGRVVPKWTSPTGIDTPFQSAFYGNNIVMYMPNTGTTAGINLGTPWTVGTTIAHPAPTAGVYTQIKRTTSTNVVTTTNQILAVSSIATSAAQFWRGNAAGLGGFFFFARFGIETLTAASPNATRLFVGLQSGTTSILASDTVAGDVIGLWHDTTDGANVLNIVTRDNVTTTKNALAGTPTTPYVTGQAYDFYLYSAPNGSEIFYRLDNLNTGAILSEGSISVGIPRNTVFMGPVVGMSNGTANIVASTVGIGINKIYIEADR